MNMALEDTGDSENPVIPRLCFVLCALIVAPNALLFSCDDIEGFRNTIDTWYFQSNQGGNGRYIFSFCIIIAKFLRVDYSSFLCLSEGLLIISMPMMFFQCCFAVGIKDRRSCIIGFTVYASFGLSLDMYQFLFASASFAFAFLSVAGAVWCATRTTSIRLRTAGSAAGAFAGFGSYQTAGQLLVMAALALLIVPSMIETPKHTRARKTGAAIVLVFATSIGASFYFLVNSALKFIGMPGFSAYPARAQGLQFVLPNLPHYFNTLCDLIGSNPNPYTPLLPLIWHLAFWGVLSCAVAKILSARTSRRWIAIASLIVSLFAWPNPANVLLAQYWPSARSLSGFGLLLGLLCAALATRRSANPARLKSGRLSHAWLYLLLSTQAMTAVLRFHDRTFQQSADIVLAEAILSRAYELAPDSAQVLIRLAIDADDVGTAGPVVFDYGRSLFSTPWSGPAFLEYVSGLRVRASTADPNDCGLPRYRMTYIKQADSLLVCLRFPRRDPLSR